MQMDRKVRYAVAGLGVGKNHVKGALKSTNGELYAVCDLRDDRLEKAEELCPGVKKYKDFDEMIKNPDIDAVSICLPSGMHAEYAIKAMEAGKHVLIEKPIEITVEAALKIEEARKRTGKIAGVIHQNRNNADIQELYKIIQEGKLGKIMFGDFAVKWFRTQEYYERDGGWRGTWEMDGGGSLMNQAVHTVDLMQWLMDSEVESVTSEMRIFDHDIKTEDFTASLIRFKNGTVATFISTTCAYPGLSTDIRIYGTEGSVECDQDIAKLWKIKGQTEEEEKEILERLKGNATAAALDPALCMGHDSMLEDMIDAVYYGRDPQILPMEAIKSVKIINAVYESAKTGKTIYLD